MLMRLSAATEGLKQLQRGREDASMCTVLHRTYQCRGGRRRRREDLWSRSIVRVGSRGGESGSAGGPSYLALSTHRDEIRRDRNTDRVRMR
jgi:hypothetical protein